MTAPVPHNALDSFFVRARARALPSKPAVPFIMAGDPDQETAFACASAVYAAGARMLEIGMPFSDPMADGPVIQAAGQRALAKGTNTRDALSLCGRIAKTFPDLALILMGYYNPVRAFGEEAFAKAAKEAGASGVIIVDLPLGCDGDLPDLLRSQNIHYIRLYAPNTKHERLKALAEAATGCLYYVSVTGVTGQKTASAETFRTGASVLRSFTDVPVMAGFGIKNRQDLAAALACAQGAVVGSALINAIASGTPEGAAHRAESFWRELCA